MFVRAPRLRGLGAHPCEDTARASSRKPLVRDLESTTYESRPSNVFRDVRSQRPGAGSHAQAADTIGGSGASGASAGSPSFSTVRGDWLGVGPRATRLLLNAATRLLFTLVRLGRSDFRPLSSFIAATLTD